MELEESWVPGQSSREKRKAKAWKEREDLFRVKHHLTCAAASARMRIQITGYLTTIDNAQYDQHSISSASSSPSPAVPMVRHASQPSWSPVSRYTDIRNGEPAILIGTHHT